MNDNQTHGPGLPGAIHQVCDAVHQIASINHFLTECGHDPDKQDVESCFPQIPSEIVELREIRLLSDDVLKDRLANKEFKQFQKHSAAETYCQGCRQPAVPLESNAPPTDLSGIKRTPSQDQQPRTSSQRKAMKGGQGKEECCKQQFRDGEPFAVSPITVGNAC